jgi:hypothetical protein
MLEALTAASFETHAGSEFALRLGDANVTLVLAEITRFPVQSGAPRAEPFSLVFKGEPGVNLPQQIHSLEHPAFGRLDLFLVPIGPAPSGEMRYEAVFN